MRIPDAFIEFLVYFQGIRDYFECHEILEDEWKKDPVGRRKDYWKGFIAIAVSQYHHRRENFKGAGKAIDNAITRLENEEMLLHNLGIDGLQLMNVLNETKERIQQQKSYKSIQIPIIHPVLFEKCVKRTAEKGCVFGNESDMTDDALIHKHSLPERDTVLSKRERAYRNGHT